MSIYTDRHRYTQTHEHMDMWRNSHTYMPAYICNCVCIWFYLDLSAYFCNVLGAQLSWPITETSRVLLKNSHRISLYQSLKNYLLNSKEQGFGRNIFYP